MRGESVEDVRREKQVIDLGGGRGIEFTGTTEGWLSRSANSAAASGLPAGMPNRASRRGGIGGYPVWMRKLTVSVDDFTAAYLESTGNASAWIRQAAHRAALVEAGRSYGEFEQAAGLVAAEYHHAMLRLHSAQAHGGAAA